MTNSWTENDIPDQSGKTTIVTGANSGLGFETALALAGKGASVVLACRNLEKGEQARVRIRESYPDAALELMGLDLADLSSVREFARDFLSGHEELHILCNNAGIMAIPLRKTADGFEMQFGTNHLGHFALTGLLLDRLLKTPKARVVNVSSIAHRQGKIDFDNLSAEKSYGRLAAYGQSKLANLLFTFELQRRLERVGADTITAASHPGWAATNLQFAGPRMSGSALQAGVMTVLNALFSQSQRRGALPSLYACTAEDVQGGDYYGPNGFQQMWGLPKKVGSNRRSRDTEVAAKLWEKSEELTGVAYKALVVQPA